MTHPEQHLQNSTTRPIKILHVEYGLGFGGSVVSLAELIRGLRTEGGVESRVIAFQPESVVQGLFRDVTVLRLRPLLSYRLRAALMSRFRPGVPWSMMRWPVMKLYSAFDFLHDAYIAAVLARHGRIMDADIIHLNNGWSTSGLWAARLLHVPCIAHFRGFAPTVSNRTGRRGGNWIERTLLGCIGISRAVSDSIVSFGIPARKVRTIHNSVSLERYSVKLEARNAVRSRHGFMENHVVVAVFGRIMPWKGQLEFLRALAPALEQFPDMRILLVGDESDTDSPAYGQEVRALADHPSLARKVVLAGYQNDVAVYYGASDIVVHCSREPEPFGRVVIEAMAAGKAVVAMAEAGPLEIISNEIDGLLVPPRDDAAVRTAVTRLCEDSRVREALGVAARRTVAERFSPPVIAREFLLAIRDFRSETH